MSNGPPFLAVTYRLPSAPKAVQGASLTASGPGLVREQEDTGLTLCMALPRGCLWAEGLPHEGPDSSPDSSWDQGP